MKFFFSVSLTVILLAGTFVPSEAAAQFFMMENPLLEEAAPDFTLKTTSGKKINMTEYRDGQNAIVFFWATWCPHCRTQLSELNKSIAEIEKTGIKLVIVDMGENEKIVQSYLKKNKIKLNVFLDEQSSQGEAYALIGVPTFFFVNADGVVKAVKHELPKNLEKMFK